MEKATTLEFTPQDKELIARIRELSECPLESIAVRLAIRRVARGEIPSTPAINKQHGFSPRAQAMGFYAAV